MHAWAVRSGQQARATDTGRAARGKEGERSRSGQLRGRRGTAWLCRDGPPQIAFVRMPYRSSPQPPPKLQQSTARAHRFRTHCRLEIKWTKEGKCRAKFRRNGRRCVHSKQQLPAKQRAPLRASRVRWVCVFNGTSSSACRETSWRRSACAAVSAAAPASTDETRSARARCDMLSACVAARASSRTFSVSTANRFSVALQRQPLVARILGAPTLGDRPTRRR
jgi:hypothetical protein